MGHGVLGERMTADIAFAAAHFHDYDANGTPF
jgi:hypothetical protein